MSYFYHIGWGSHEDSQHEQYSFDKKLSEDELRQYVEKATVRALEEAIKDKEGKDEKMFFFYDGGISFESLWGEIKRQLEKLGFVPLDFTAGYSIFGWPTICGKSWEGQRGDTLKSLAKAIPEELKEKARLLAEKED